MKHDNSIRIIGVTGGVGSGKSAVMDILAKEYKARIILADLVSHELMEPGQAGYEEVVREFGPEILKQDPSEPGDTKGCPDPQNLEKKGENPSERVTLMPPIDRKKLGAIVFSDPDKLAKLNRISHKEVKEEILRRIRNYIRDFTRDKSRSDTGFLLKDSSGESADKMTTDNSSGEKKLLIAVEAALLIGSGLESDLDSLWYIYVRDEERIRRLQESRGYTEEYAGSIISRQLSDSEFRKHCRTVIDNNGDLAETRIQVDQAIRDLYTRQGPPKMTLHP